MKTRLRIAGTVLLLAISLGLLDRCLHWMNQPSDLSLWRGLLGLLLLLVLTPAAITLIWTERNGRRV